MSKIDIDPEILAEIDAEAKVATATNNSYLRFQLEKGHDALIRILPAKLGPKKTFYARIGKHWFGKGKAPMACRRTTAPQFGGDPDADCPLCALLEKYNHHDSDEVRKAAFRYMASPSWFMYVAVKEKDGEKTTPDTRFKAYEWSAPKGLFDEVLTAYRRGLSRSVLSITDFECGNDFYIRRLPNTNKHKLDKQDPGPIFNIADEEKLKKRLNELMSSINFSAPVFPKSSDLEKAADMVDDSMRALIQKMKGDDDENDDDGIQGSHRRRSADSDEDDDEKERSRSRSHSSGDDDDDDAPVARRKKETDDEDDERPKAKRAVDDEDDLDYSKPATKSMDEDEDSDEKPVIKSGAGGASLDKVKTSGASGAKYDDDENDDDAPNRRPPPPAAKVVAPSVSSKPAPDDDDLPDESGETVEPAQKIDADDTPEPVAAKGARPRTHSRITDRIKRIHSREEE